MVDRRSGEMKLEGVSKSYGEGPLETEVIKDCSATIPAGQLTVMIGPSGCGKSTLIRLLAGFERPDEGTITIDGKKVTRPDKDRLVLFQETALFPWMTTWENVMYGPKARGEANREAREHAEFLLEKVGLSQFRDKYPEQLSGGMQRRAELARAMVNHPAITILDEPFRGLDAMTKELMQEYYSKLYEETRSTTLFITTDIDEAVFLADQIIVMTNIPTQVKQVINVDIQRPRSYVGMITDDRANDIKHQAMTILHEEAMKAFRSGSKAAADFVEAYQKRSETEGS